MVAAWTAAMRAGLSETLKSLLNHSRTVLKGGEGTRWAGAQAASPLPPLSMSCYTPGQGIKHGWRLTGDDFESGQPVLVSIQKIKVWIGKSVQKLRHATIPWFTMIATWKAVLPDMLAQFLTVQSRAVC